MTGPAHRSPFASPRVRRWLVLGFVLAIALSALFGVRTAVRAVQFARYAEEPIQPWMTIGFVARSRKVDPDALAAALGLPPDRRDRRPLSEIAAGEGRPVEALIERLDAAVADAKSRPP